MGQEEEEEEQEEEEQEEEEQEEEEEDCDRGMVKVTGNKQRRNAEDNFQKIGRAHV